MTQNFRETLAKRTIKAMHFDCTVEEYIAKCRELGETAAVQYFMCLYGIGFNAQGQPVKVST